MRTQGLLVTLFVQYACLVGGLGSFPWGADVETLSDPIPVLQLVAALSSWMTGASMALTLHQQILSLMPWYLILT